MDPSALSDIDLAGTVADVVSEPRRDPADSFVLHAPLELLARVALLPRVRPANRDAARARIVDIAAKLDAFGPAVDRPPAASFASTANAAGRLAAAVERGEVDDADATAAWLGDHATPVELATLLGDAVVGRLAAAGHAPIFLAHWPSVSPRGEVTGTLLRPLARALAEEPTPRITWVDRADHGGSMAAPDATVPPLFEAIAAGPHLGRPKIDFIAPIMQRVDGDDLAALLAPSVAAVADGSVALVAATRDVLRAAAWSMLLEPGPSSPYLWSHCLTMPQAVLAIAPLAKGPERHVAVAATYVAAFRSAFAARPLVTVFDAPAPEVRVADAIDAGQEVAAAAAWHITADGRAALIDELVNRAAVHEDAHLVKYTLACLDAAATDPDGTRVYLAAAASLSGWWAANDSAE